MSTAPTEATDQATEGELRQLFSMEQDDGPLAARIDVCAGYWLRVDGSNLWTFHDETGDE